MFPLSCGKSLHDMLYLHYGLRWLIRARREVAQLFLYSIFYTFLKGRQRSQWHECPHLMLCVCVYTGYYLLLVYRIQIKILSLLIPTYLETKKGSIHQLLLLLSLFCKKKRNYVHTGCFKRTYSSLQTKQYLLYCYYDALCISWNI